LSLYYAEVHCAGLAKYLDTQKIPSNPDCGRASGKGTLLADRAQTNIGSAVQRDFLNECCCGDVLFDFCHAIWRAKLFGPTRCSRVSSAVHLFGRHAVQ
jgi:hypothetical protein